MVFVILCLCLNHTLLGLSKCLPVWSSADLLTYSTLDGTLLVRLFEKYKMVS